MKVGAENKKVLVAAVVSAVLALVFVVRGVMQLSAAPPAAPATSNAAQQGPQARRVRGAAQAQLPKTNPLDPTLRLDLLKSSEDVEYKGSGRNIFAAAAEPIPQPKAPVIVKGPPPMQCPGDPACPKPPIPLKFYGFANKPGEPKKIFLSSGEDVFVAAEGEIVNRRYRVLHIGVNSVEIEDVLQNNRQTIPLTQS
jgi:hypothetical protein